MSLEDFMLAVVVSCVIIIPLFVLVITACYFIVAPPGIKNTYNPKPPHLKRPTGKF